jgi:hypothetical protein
MLTTRAARKPPVSRWGCIPFPPLQGPHGSARRPPPTAVQVCSPPHAALQPPPLEAPQPPARDTGEPPATPNPTMAAAPEGAKESSHERGRQQPHVRLQPASLSPAAAPQPLPTLELPYPRDPSPLLPTWPSLSRGAACSGARDKFSTPPLGRGGLICGSGQREGRMGKERRGSVHFFSCEGKRCFSLFFLSHRIFNEIS